MNHSKQYKDPETGTCTNTIEGKWYGLKSATPKKNRGKYLSSFLFQSIWFDQNHGDVWSAFLKALGTVRYVTGGADAAALVTSDESEDEEEEQPPPKPLEGEEPPPSKPSGGECNFVISTQYSSESDDEEEIKSDEDVRKWGAAPGRLTSHEIAK